GGFVARGGVAPYVAANQAVLGLTGTGAAHSGARGIRVNALVVGTVRTELMEEALRGRPDAEKSAGSRGIQRRMGEPEEIAQAAAWLCSDRASFVTGGAVPVDGGCTAI
ncbi:SDR family NAD(P)-dependent oxidoreductase, partial [Streptomyces sp. NPDC059385]|uniref:SDR family NAD(P)-dependent oxidoreductase n=1 Tax=Streptomyces sp. NPDC059385 TaxID=3346817 RepID=UPI003679A780